MKISAILLLVCLLSSVIVCILRDAVHTNQVEELRDS